MQHALHRHAAFLLLALATLAPLAMAQPVDAGYPDKPMRFIVGFAPGGGTDTVARILAQRLSESFGQPVIVDNRPGAGGTIANSLAAKSTPDAYTILFVSASFAIQPSLYKKLPYDPQKAFTAVSLASSSPYLLAVHPSVAANSVRELIALAKAQPGKLNYASAGTGSTLHLAAELFKSMAGVDIVHVPYKGATGIVDLLAGAVQLTFAGLPQTLPHVKAGRLRGLGVTTAHRSDAIPELPAISEAGVPGYEVDAWYGVLVPAGTPRSRVAALSTAISRALAEPEVKSQFVNQGLAPRGSSPEAFAAYVRKEISKWAKVVRNAGIPAQ